MNLEKNILLLASSNVLIVIKNGKAVKLGRTMDNNAIDVIPSNLQRLFVYICDNCKAKWKWAYVTDGLKCDKSKSSTLVRP
jgi:hypothetical protein